MFSLVTFSLGTKDYGHCFLAVDARHYSTRAKERSCKIILLLY